MYTSRTLFLNYLCGKSWNEKFLVLFYENAKNFYDTENQNEEKKLAREITNLFIDGKTSMRGIRSSKWEIKEFTI